MGFPTAVTGRGSPRLTRALDVRRVLSEGRRFSGERTAVYVLGSEGETRVGFSCSRSVGGAVVRNRARRVMREAWRSLSDRAPGGHWVVVIGRPSIVGARVSDVADDLQAVLTSAGVIQ